MKLHRWTPSMEFQYARNVSVGPSTIFQMPQELSLKVPLRHLARTTQCSKKQWLSSKAVVSPTFSLLWSQFPSDLSRKSFAIITGLKTCWVRDPARPATSVTYPKKRYLEPMKQLKHGRMLIPISRAWLTGKSTTSISNHHQWRSFCSIAGNWYSTRRIWCQLAEVHQGVRREAHHAAPRRVQSEVPRR